MSDKNNEKNSALAQAPKLKNYNIHDFIFKTFATNTHNIKMLVEKYLDTETLAILNLDTIAPVNLKELTTNGFEKAIMDSCFKIYAKAHKHQYALLVVEHQSHHDPKIFLRHMLYIFSLLKYNIFSHYIVHFLF